MADVKVVRLLFHEDEGSWWADSPDLPGFMAAADTFEEVRAMAGEGAAFFAGEVVAITEAMDFHASFAGEVLTFSESGTVASDGQEIRLSWSVVPQGARGAAADRVVKGRDLTPEPV
jgi:predicted RNase H-like HicB family nuclease